MEDLTNIPKQTVKAEGAESSKAEQASIDLKKVSQDERGFITLDGKKYRLVAMARAFQIPHINGIR